MKCPVDIADVSVIKRLMTACVKSLPVLALICVSVHAQTLTDRVDSLLAKWNHKDEPGMAVLLIRNPVDKPQNLTELPTAILHSRFRPRLGLANSR